MAMKLLRLKHLPDFAGGFRFSFSAPNMDETCCDQSWQFLFFVSRIDNVKVRDLRVFIRVDFSVPRDTQEIFGQRVVGSS